MSELERELRRQYRELGVLIDAGEQEILAAWIRAFDDIADELARIIDAYIADPNVTRAVQLRYMRRAQRLVADAILRGLAVSQVEATVLARRLIERAATDQARLIQAQLPTVDRTVSAGFTRLPVDATDAMVRRSTKQITSKLLPLSADADAAMRQVLRTGVASGRNPKVIARDMVKRVRGEFDGGMARAVTIARTEVIDAYRAAAKASHRANRDVLDGWEWYTQLGARTCMACIAMAGTRHSLEEDGPQGHPRCRCTRLPVVKSWRELGIDVPETPRKPQDGDAWLRRQSPAVQADILGPTRHQQWQQGKPLSGMVHTVDNPNWRPSVQPKPLGAS